MAVSTPEASTSPLARAEKDRPVRELVVVVFAPLTRPLVQALHALRVSPPTVVLVHGGVGLASAVALAGGEPVVAAVLLQLRTLLDNADGLLARASGRVTLLGRYLDSEVDLVVNAALFVALGSVTGEPWLALAAFLAVTFLLSADFNLSELHRELHGRATPVPVRTGSRLERVLEAVYRVLFAPQDRVLRAFADRRLRRAIAGEADPEKTRRATVAYHDWLTLGFLANTGFSTQHAVLGVLLVVGFGLPAAYLWLALACLVPLPLLQARRERLTRSALRGPA